MNQFEIPKINKTAGSMKDNSSSGMIDISMNLFFVIIAIPKLEGSFNLFQPDNSNSFVLSLFSPGIFFTNCMFKCSPQLPIHVPLNDPADGKLLYGK